MNKPIGKPLIFRMVCIVLLWLALCYLLIASAPLTLYTVFVIIVSGIVVFVPLYKKHFRKGSND